ncbi:microtubule-associated protein futsch [Bactrocera dorsalis]|uniref:Microtubule-associated protein futsch n=1 Tax=Bactrocera dorsalis TaxID=27457 RepID=A0A6J0RLT2_BACDO|nr:microtubule-associated protein futsch [Bactrocera dorsalis]
MALDGAKFICLSDAAAADATEATPTETTGVEAGGIGDASTSENIIIEAKGRKFTVGYYMNCDYVLEDPRAIGVHCEIQCDAFGRVTIHNNSEAHPISVNEQIITLKRPLLDGSRIKILDRIFLWKFPKTLEPSATNKSAQEEDATTNNTVSTPQKLIAVPEQAPNSCPDLKHHRKVDKRFTVHNFAYCINSDEEGNTSSDLPSINESERVEEAATTELVTQKESINKNGRFEEMSVEDKEVLPTSATLQDSADGKTTFDTLSAQRRSITPEPQKNEPIIASTPLVKLEDTPKMNLINSTQNKQNTSTEKKLRMLSFCQQSDVVITSFSPRETGIRIEKSFTAVIKPTSTSSTTPKSVYSTPKSMLSNYDDDESRDFIDFSTPATSKKGARVLVRNSSMHLIDLTTPSKLAPHSPRHRLTHKGNKTLPSQVKFSTTSITSDKLKEEDSERVVEAHLVSKTPTLETSLNKSESSPQSAESIISVDETSDSSTAVIEISEDDSPAPSTSSPVRTDFTTKTPQRPTGKKFTSTPLRTPQSLLKRAIVTSAKKQINSSLRAALGKTTPARQLTSTPANNRKLEPTGTAESTPPTSKSRISLGSPGSVAAAQRRNISSLTPRISIGVSPNREHVITPSTTPHTRLTQNRKVPFSASRLNTAKRTSPLRGVRKSFGGTTLTSHISKTRRSVISPRKHSPTAIATKLAAKARKSFIPSPNNSRVASRARSLVAAAMSPKNSNTNSTTDVSSPKRENVRTVDDTTEKEVKKEASLEEQTEVDELSRTFTVDDSLEEVPIKTSNPSTSCALDASSSQKQEVNKTFSPERPLTSEDKIAVDLTADVAETKIGSHKRDLSEDLNEKDDKIEHISESFAEVVEANTKTEESSKTLTDTVQSEKQNTIETLEPSTSYSTEEQADDVKTTAEKSTIEVDNQQESKLIEDQVIETLDAYEISGNISEEQQHSNTGEKDNVLTSSPSSSEKIDTEVVPKQSAESQGTAELLEEIEYVLNKSDELQQQLGKDTHPSNIEVRNEFEAAIEEKSRDDTEDVTPKDNIKTVVNINADSSQHIEQPEDSETTNKNEPTTSSTSNSIVPHSKEYPETQENASSTNSNFIVTESEITSTDIDDSSKQTELLSNTSKATPSEFDASTIESTSVQKSMVSDECETGNEKSENTNNIANIVNSESEENDTSIQTELAGAKAVEAETVAEAESTAGVLEGMVHTTVENDASNEEGSVDKSKIDENDSAEILKDSQTLELGKDAKKMHTAVVITLTEPGGVDNDTQKIVDNNKNKEITMHHTELFTTECKETDSVATEFEECKSVTSESEVAVTTVEDAEKVAEEIKLLSNSSKTISAVSEPDSNVDDETSSKVEDQIPANSDRNSDSEKENNVRVADACKKMSAKTADETKKTPSFEPKTPNLCGVRDMLRTPKQIDSTTPRFVGLRDLMRTPKASTSAAAAASAVETDTEELIGVQKLLNTPRLSKIKAETQQNTTEDSKFTPRRSTRRRASANPELTPTSKTITETDNTPSRTTRRRASASAEVNYTPQRITRRRSSLALDNEGAADKVLTPIKRGGSRSKRPGTIAETPVAEDMGAIIEEEPKECVQETTEGQQDIVETQKNKEDVKTKNSAQDVPEVIEESICEEINIQNQNVEEQKEEIVEDKSNNECEKAEKFINDTQAICVTGKLDGDIEKIEIATETESPSQQTQGQEDVADSSCNVSEVHKEERRKESKDLTADKNAEIRDESDYEYGKEVMEHSEATVSTDAQPKTPKTQRKTVRIADTDIENSPKTPVMVGVRELLKTPKDCSDTPKLAGVRDLLRTPKVTIDTTTNDDAEQVTGLADLMKTPKVAKTHFKNVEATDEGDEPSSSTKAQSDFIGMRELLKTPKHTSTPYYSGMREMLRSPKACSTPQLAGVRELMQTPKRTKLDEEYDDKNEELDQFFKTPRAKNIMIPADPASAILEPSSDSSAEIMMAATTEYELHSNSQRPLEEIYKTPVSTRLTSIEIEKDTSLTVDPCEVEVNIPETPAAICDNPPKAITSKRNLSAEETFDEMVGLRTTLDETPPQKVYARKQQSNVAVSPFSATDVVSDLPKTDIQEWVDNLEQEPESVVEEQEFTASTSILNASKATHDPIAASACEISGINTTEQLLADMSAVSSMVDPLQPSARKPTKSSPTIVVDENETLRPVTPTNAEISGINLLDQTNDSMFSEPLVVSDTESDQLEGNENDKAETESVDAKKSQDAEEIPIMFVDSSDSEPEEDINATEKTGTKEVKVKSPIESVKITPEEEIIELDDESIGNAEVTTKPSDIHEEFSNFQLHKNVAGQQMRASTPNRSLIQSTKDRRQSMGAEQFITKVSIDLSIEKTRLAKEKERTVIDTVVEVDEVSVDEATTKDNVMKIDEEPIESSSHATEIKSTNPSEDEPSGTTTVSKDNDSEFCNFHANKLNNNRGKRAATPDQVNKSRSLKTIQGRRLTLGAELHLPKVTIDFDEEKLRLEESKQQPTIIEENVEAVATEVTILVSKPDKPATSANESNNTENVEDEDKLDVKPQLDTAENASEMEANTFETSRKEFEKDTFESDKNSVPDVEGEVSLKDKDNVEIIANEAKCSAEESETGSINTKNVEENIVDTCEHECLEDVATGAIEKKNNVNKTENVDPAATGSNFDRETTRSCDDSPPRTLAAEEENKSKETTESCVSEIINEAKSEFIEIKLKEEPEGTTAEKITPTELTKEENKKCSETTGAAATTKTITQETTETPDVNKTEISISSTVHVVANPEVQSTVGIAEIKSEKQDLEEAPESTIVEEIEAGSSINKANENKTDSEGYNQVPNNVSIEVPETLEESSAGSLQAENKISSAGDVFNESDIFDLTEELPNETPTINTTQGVIFDLSEEDAESTAETNTAENTTPYEPNQYDVTESTTVSIDSNAIKTSEATEAEEDNEKTGFVENKEESDGSAVVYQEIALCKEDPITNTEVSRESEIAEKEVKTTGFKELKASNDEKSPLDTNTSTYNEAFTLVVSTESELDNDNEMPEVAPKTIIAGAEQEVPFVKADTNNEVEEPNNETVQANITETVEIEAIEASETELHTDAEDITEEPATIITTEPTKVATVETGIDSEIPTSTTLTVEEADTTDNKDSNEIDRIDIGECMVSEMAISTTNSPITMETKHANKDTKEELQQEAKQFENLRSENAEITDEVKGQTVTAAEIVDAPVQEKSEVIGDNEEPSCSKQTGKANNETEITTLIIAPSIMSHAEQDTVETLETVSDKVQVNKSKSLIEDKVTEVQTHIYKGEKGNTDEVQLSASKSCKTSESRVDISKMSVEETTELIENIETVEKEREISNETQGLIKRRGRKPSRSKPTTEKNVDLVSTTTIAKTILVEEYSDDKKSILVTSKHEESSAGKVQTTVDAAAATSTRYKTEPEYYTKVNYEVCILESAETALDVKSDKHVEIVLPDQSEKLKKDTKYADHSEIMDNVTGQQLASSTELDEEIDTTETTSKVEEVHEPKRERRTRKGSQSSQCSTHDEDHLPTTTTRRRGGRRRADTPIERIEVSTSDPPTVKRRCQGHNKLVEDMPLEEIQEIPTEETEIVIPEENVIEAASENSGASIEEHHSGDIINDVKKSDHDHLEEVVGSTIDKEQHVDSENAIIKSGTSRRQRVAKATDDIGDHVTDLQHSDTEELSSVSAATKRGRRKPTLSESSQTSVTSESLGTKRRRRGHNATSDKSNINEAMDEAEKKSLHKIKETLQVGENDATTLPVLPTIAKAVKAELLSEAEVAVEGASDAIKTEEDHSTDANSSKRTENKRTRKASNKELPDETRDMKIEQSHDEKAVVEQEQPLKKVAATSRARVNRRKKAGVDDDHHEKTEEPDLVHKDEGTVETEAQNKIEVSEQAVLESTNADSVGGRRGRRGAAAAATVAINEVSSAHKRSAVRGKSHQNKSHATRKEEETTKTASKKEQSETVTDLDDPPIVVDEKNQHKSVRRRRISLKEMQPSHAVTAEEGVEQLETEEVAEPSTRVVTKRSRKRRESHHVDEQQLFNKSEARDETPTSVPAESPTATSTKQRSRRKRKDSHQNLNDEAVGDEPPKKRPLSRKRRDSSLDSSIHEGTGIDMDTIHGANTSSSSTTPQRPRRAAAAQDRNYDESSDAEAQVDLKRRIEKASLPKASANTSAATAVSSSKQGSPIRSKTPTKAMVPAAVAEITAKTTSTPILSTVITTSRGRQRKPTARVQQYLEEERAKAETPKKRLLLGSAAVGETSTSQAGVTPVRRTRKASTVETEGSETVNTMARGRTRTAKILHVAETSEESRSEVEHTHSELETTHSSSHVEEKGRTTKSKATKRPPRGRGKQPISAVAAESEIPDVLATVVATPTEATLSGTSRTGRAAKAAAAAALITDDLIGSHTKPRGGRTRRGAVTVEEEVQPSDAEVKEVQTETVVTLETDVEQTNKKTRKTAAGGRTARGGRSRNKPQDVEDATDEHTLQHASLTGVETSRNVASHQQPQHPIIADADDEHEDDDETLTTEAADLEVATSLAGAKLAGKKRTAASRKAAAATASAAESPIPKRGRRRAVAANTEESDAASQLDTRAESAASSRSRKVVRFDAATPSSVASATMSVDTAAEEETTTAPAAPTKRATRSRRK